MSCSGNLTVLSCIYSTYDWRISSSGPSHLKTVSTDTRCSNISDIKHIKIQSEKQEMFIFSNLVSLWFSEVYKFINPID